MRSSRMLLLCLSVLVAIAVSRPLGERLLRHPESRSAPGAGQDMPLPTIHRLDADAERRNAAGRRQWIQEMHRTAPGTDWLAIERTNGLTRQERRNQVVRTDSRWTELGSRNQAGRMHVATVPVAGDSLYGGSSRGGVWKGSLDGEGWRPISDNLFGGSHGLAVAGISPEVITSTTDNGQVRYSEDGGATWHVPSGIIGEIQASKRVMRDPADPDRVYLMVRVNIDGKVLYRSDDAGRSYVLVLQLDSDVGDFWLDRVVGGDVYVLRYNTLQVSVDQGENWTTLGSLPVSISRVVLSASEAGAPTFYAAAKIGGQWQLYRSVDGGLSWSFRYDIDDFWETLCASIVDADLVAFAGVELWRSTDGGASFLRVNRWWEYYDDPEHMLHADFPGLDCLWIGSREVFYAATDGGLYRSNNSLSSVNNISLFGLGVSQYYSTLTSVNDPNLVAAGSQDQGYQLSTGPAKNRNWDFVQMISGDYGHLTSSDGSHNIVFSVYPGFVLVHTGEPTPAISGMLDFPPGESYSWLPFILADPDDPQAYFFCATHLHRGDWQGGDAVQYSTSDQDFTEAGGSYLTALGIAPADHQRRIAVTNSGRIWYSRDGGNNWSLSADTGPNAHYFYGTAIEYSETDPTRAWIAGSGYSGPAVYRTDDGGLSWTPVGNNQPRTLVYDLALESPGNEVLYAATDAGPYRLDPQTNEWEDIGAAVAPLTTYWSVESVPAAQVIRFGTYGRGIWDYDVSGTTDVAINETPAAAGFDLTNYPNPFNPQTTIIFQLVDPAQVRLAVYDAAGREVAVLVQTALGSGEHRVNWDGQDQHGRSVASGVYWSRLEVAGRVESRVMTLAR